MTKTEAMGEVPLSDPMRAAWERYKLTDMYANSRKWAAHEEHVDGSMWAAFVEGYRTAQENHNDKE